MKPERMEPALKDYLWGGARLKSVYPQAGDLDRVAEAWVLSSHKGGNSIIRGGENDGVPFSAYLKKYGVDATGSYCGKYTYFPILIKLIDAKENLSVQVHPDDEYALRVEGEYGKTEMWYVVDCEPGAFLYYGFSRDITQEEFALRIQDNTLLEVLNKVPVTKGDYFFIPSGTVHAIGGGILIAEIQQNSNTTYRLYDYGRLSPDGNPRELHIEKGIHVANLRAVQGQIEKLTRLDCGYFSVSLLTADRNSPKQMETDGTSFHSLLCMKGGGTLRWDTGSMEIQTFDSFFIPAGCGAYTLEGDFQALLTSVS